MYGISEVQYHCPIQGCYKTLFSASTPTDDMGIAMMLERPSYRIFISQFSPPLHQYQTGLRYRAVEKLRIHSCTPPPIEDCT